MAETFTAAVVEQLKQNLGDALRALTGEPVEGGELLVQLLSQLLISAFYLALFVGIYLLLMGAIRLVIGKRRAQKPLFSQVRSGARYLAGLGALLVILAQFGASPEFLKAMARAGLMALGFFVAWLVVGRLMREGMTRYRMDPSIRQLVENLLLVLATTLAVVTVLAQFGFDVLSLLLAWASWVLRLVLRRNPLFQISLLVSPC